MWLSQSVLQQLVNSHSCGIDAADTSDVAGSVHQTSSYPIYITQKAYIHTHTYTRLTAPFPGLPGWACTRNVKPIWILLKQETVSGSGISWAICKSAPRSIETTMPAPHRSVFYRPDALPAAQPTASKHWRHRKKHIQLRYQSPGVTWHELMLLGQ